MNHRVAHMLLLGVICDDFVSLQITVTEDGIIGVHGWLPFDKNIINYYTFEKDATVLSQK